MTRPPAHIDSPSWRSSNRIWRDWVSVLRDSTPMEQCPKKKKIDVADAAESQHEPATAASVERDRLKKDKYTGGISHRPVSCYLIAEYAYICAARRRVQKAKSFTCLNPVSDHVRRSSFCRSWWLPSNRCNGAQDSETRSSLPPVGTKWEETKERNSFFRILHRCLAWRLGFSGFPLSFFRFSEAHSRPITTTATTTDSVRGRSYA
jgi:hypothetical protein